MQVRNILLSNNIILAILFDQNHTGKYTVLEVLFMKYSADYFLYHSAGTYRTRYWRYFGTQVFW